MRWRGPMVILAASLAVAGFLVAACSSFSADDSGANEDATSEGPTSPNAMVATDAMVASDTSPAIDASRPPVDCDASHCRASSERYLFVSGETLRGDFAAEAGTAPDAIYAVADALCTKDANANALYPDLAGRSWSAWLCLDGQAAVNRSFPTAKWTRPDGSEVFSSTDELKSGSADTPISSSVAAVWTGCEGMPFGQPSSGNTCSSWTSTMNNGAYGTASFTDERWNSSGEQSCTTSASLFCFETTP